MGGIALVLAVATVFVVVFRRFGQPAVVGEIAAGICLGPSLLGLFPGNLPERLFPMEIRSYLGVAAQVGLLFFMFIIGWEFDGSSLRGRRRSTGAIWFSSIALPMAMGIGLAALIYDAHRSVDGRTIPFLEFSLYLGVAMSITAFPVLARIITDHDLQFSRAGVLALTLAAADDVLAWCMLAVVVALTTASGAGSFLQVMAWSVVYLAVMLAVVRPLLRVVARRLGPTHSPYLALLAASGTLCSAFVTSHIGIHAIFGAFMFGMVMPRDRDGVLHRAAMQPLENVGKVLLPLFFVVTGLSVDLSEMTKRGWLEMIAIICVACLGKLGGVSLSARATGMRWRDAGTLGVLMNTRGLTELVLLNVGLQLGLLSVQLFTAMVLMALITTGMAAPILTALLKRSRDEAFQILGRDLDDAAAGADQAGSDQAGSAEKGDSVGAARG